MKKHYAILASLLIGIMLAIPSTQAIDESEIYGLLGFIDDPIYGLVNYVYLHPDNETLDTEADLTFSYTQGDITGFTESTLAVYKYDYENYEWEYVGGELDTAGNTVTVTISETGQYVMAPAVPSGDIDFTSSNPSMTFNGSNTKTITTETITNNDGTDIADGELFTVTLSNGTIKTNDASTSLDGHQVESSGGSVSVQIQSSAIAEDAILVLTSEHEKATGFVTITAIDAGDPNPPSNIRVEESDGKAYLYWDESDAEDLAGYYIYYREMGAAGWYGDAPEELPSPIDVLVGASYYQLHLEDNTEYQIYMKAVDAAGNESISGGIINFSTGDLSNFTSSGTTSPSSSASGLTDIGNHWAEDYINDLVDLGAIQGYSDNTFKPNNQINRAEALKILLAAEGVDESDYDASTMAVDLDDVASGSWYEPYVAIAIELGLVQGYPDNTFRPEQPISRGEFVKIVGAYLEAGGEVIPEEVNEPFTDVSGNDWYGKYVSFFYNADVVSGSDATHFMPGNPITRAEVAKIIVAAMEAF